MNWSKVCLGDLIEITKGKKHLETNDHSSFRYLQIEDLNGSYVKKFTKEKGTYVSENDIIIVWDGANAGKVGCGYNGMIGSTLARLSLKKKDVDVKFVKRYLEYKFEYIKSQRNGATIPHVSTESIKNLEIPLPDYAIQQKITAILDKADELRRKDIQLLTKYDELLKSIFCEMFESKESNFKEISLGELILPTINSARTGPFGSDLLHSEFVDSGIAVLGIDNAVNNVFEWGKERFITPEKYQKLKRYTVYPNDVLVTIMGTTGRSVVVPESIPLAINTKHLAALTFDINKVNPYFISHYIHSGTYASLQLRLRNRGAIMDGLNLGIIKELKVMLPPIKLQNKFEKIAKIILLEKRKVFSQMNNSESLFNALLQKAFNGVLVN